MEVDDEAEPMHYANHDEAMYLQASDVATILNLPIFGVGEEGGEEEEEEEEGTVDRGTTPRTRTYSSLTNTMDASGAHSIDGATMVNCSLFGVVEEEGTVDRGTTPRTGTYSSLSNTMDVSGAHSTFSHYTGDGGTILPSLSNTMDTSGAHSTFSHFTGDGGTTIPLLDFSSYTDGCADSYNNIDLTPRTIVPNSLSSSTMPATTNMDINQALLSLATPNRPHASTPSAIAVPPISYPNVAGSYNNIDLNPREFVSSSSSSSSLTMPAAMMNMDINQALLSLATPNIPLTSTASAVAAAAAPISYTNFGNNIGLNPQEFVSSSSLATPTMPAAMMNMDINQALLSLATPNIPLVASTASAAAAIATPIIDNSRALMTMEERIFESTSRTISRAAVAATTTKIRPASQKETTQQDELDTVTQQLSNLWHPQKPGHSLRAAVNTSPVLSRNADAAVASASASTAPITTQANLKLTMTMMSSINKVWANELNNLGSKEREEITNEMHGIQSDREKMTAQTESSPKMIDLTVQSFRLFLEININEPLDNGDSIAPPVSKDPYRRGLHVLGSRYIISKGFLLKFLRTAHYDFTKSALRYFRYLDLLYIFFGDDGITRKLCLTDLTKHEHAYLRKGQMQLLPRRDRSGRRLYAFSGYDMPTYNIIEKYRVNIFLIDAVSDDTTTQQLGCVTINAPRIRFKVKNPFGHDGMSILTGKHDLLGCTESQFFTKMFEGCKEYRKIVRFHTGSYLEMMYSLQSFGIPQDDMSITESNTIKTKYVEKFLTARRSIEHAHELERQEHGDRVYSNDYHSKEVGIECPEVNHVVFGDRRFNMSPANGEFRELVSAMEKHRQSQPVSSTINEPKHFIESIMYTARTSPYNFRFLVFDKESELYVDIQDNEELHKRTSQTLRDQRKLWRLEEKQRATTTTATAATATTNEASILGLDAAKRLKLSDDRRGCICSI